VREAFHALAVTIVPEAARLDEAGWKDLECVVDDALAARPGSVRRQLTTFVRALEWLPLLRFGRSFSRLPRSRRAGFLSSVQDSRFTLVRRGFWGLRALVLMGYYGRPEAGADIGYRADPRGWEARR
jgi:hypothetical protein